MGANFIKHLGFNFFFFLGFLLAVKKGISGSLKWKTQGLFFINFFNKTICHSFPIPYDLFFK